MNSDHVGWTPLAALRRRTVLAALGFFLLSVVGCAATKATAPESGVGSNYFPSPEEAVPQITRMLKAEDWEELASYYDLSESDVDESELLSGNYFIDMNVEARGYIPHLPSRYRRPFTPPFKFDHVVENEGSDVAVVVVSIEIDEGEGQPPMRGMDQFLMRRSDRGWQVLPEE